VLPATVRAGRRIGPALRADGPAALVSFAVRGLPAHCEEWGRAMRSELEHVGGGKPRWRFSAGCLWAAMLIQARVMVGRPARDAAFMRVSVFTGIAAAIALPVYGIVRYPGLRSTPNVWPSTAALVALLLVYAAITLALSSSSTARSRLACRYGLFGGLAVGAAWLVALSPPHLLKAWVALPLAVALLGPAVVALLAGRSARNPKAATQAALWSGIVGGLAVFAVWLSTTYLNDGRPYDPGLIQDFHRSGAPDLATYAVGEGIVNGIVLLLMVPIVALALGSLAGRFGAATGARPLTRPRR
jgi:hypothetical protein